MKKITTHTSTEQGPSVKEISDGVYVNLTNIKTDEVDFEKAIEESLKEIEKTEERKQPRKKIKTSRN
jgi:hypothetical protein